MFVSAVIRWSGLSIYPVPLLKKIVANVMINILFYCIILCRFHLPWHDHIYVSYPYLPFAKNIEAIVSSIGEIRFMQRTSNVQSPSYGKHFGCKNSCAFRQCYAWYQYQTLPRNFYKPWPIFTSQNIIELSRNKSNAIA